jgi:hypothetical protein
LEPPADLAHVVAESPVRRGCWLAQVSAQDDADRLRDLMHLRDFDAAKSRRYVSNSRKARPSDQPISKLAGGAFRGLFLIWTFNKFV